MNGIEVGTDIEQISRFNILNQTRKSALLNRLFTVAELNYCFGRKNTAAHLAARFAGKEAVVKALGNMVKKIINYKDIEILNNSHGRPSVEINEKKVGKYETKISLSHAGDFALAFVIVKKLS